jgi:hypothetical protein
MLKKLLVVAVLSLVVMGLGGCFTLSSSHNAAHFRSWYQDLIDLHEVTDKYFLNFDHNDPLEEW